jgi:hypothetical protein
VRYRLPDPVPDIRTGHGHIDIALKFTHH